MRATHSERERPANVRRRPQVVMAPRTVQTAPSSSASQCEYHRAEARAAAHSRSAARKVRNRRSSRRPNDEVRCERRCDVALQATSRAHDVRHVPQLAQARAGLRAHGCVGRVAPRRVANARAARPCSLQPFPKPVAALWMTQRTQQCRDSARPERSLSRVTPARPHRTHETAVQVRSYGLQPETVKKRTEKWLRLGEMTHCAKLRVSLLDQCFGFELR